MLNSHQHRSTAKSMSQVLSILYETGKKINSTFDVDKILEYIVNATIKKLNYHNCSLLLVEGKSLVIKAGYGYDKKRFNNFKIPIGKGVTGRVAKTGKPLIINDISKIPYYITIVPGNKSEKEKGRAYKSRKGDVRGPICVRPRRAAIALGLH